MKICYQKKKQIIYSEACPEVKLRALASDQETKLLTDCCRLAIRYAEEEPAEMPDWFAVRFAKFCKDMAKEKGQTFINKSNKQKLLLFSDYEKGEHPFINFCASGYDDSEVKVKKTGAKKKGPWRKQKYVHLSGLVAIDIDHVENADAIFDDWKQRIDFEAEKIYLIYKTPREGLRVVFRCDVSRGNLMDNQLWMCEKLGVEPDASCKDASRGFFLTSIDNFLFDNLKKMYADEADQAFIEKYEPEYRAGNSSSTKAGNKARKTSGQGSGDERKVDAGQVENNDVKWRGYELQSIIDARYGDKLPCKEDSNRHAESLKLATDLMLMLDGDKALVRKVVEAQPWVQEIIDERDENVEQTVESAAGCIAEKEKKYASSLPSKAMLEAVKAATGYAYQEIVKGQDRGQGPVSPGAQSVSDRDQSLVMQDDLMWGKLEGWGKEIESMFDEFPLLRDVCAGLKPTQYPAALFVAGGILMTLMTRCWYRFYHKPRIERRLNCSLFVIGHPASGKSMADDLYNILALPMMEADMAGKKALNEYKNATKKKAANKEGKDKPKAVIRVHPARTANGQFITDMINAHENVNGKDMQLHMFTFDTELDNSITLQSGGSWINKLSMELKAFHNEEDGQMYMNLDSPVDNFNVTWNFIYTGTPIALKKKVNEKNFGSGLSTRLAVLPMPKTNFQMLDYEDEEHIDWERINRMKEWAHKLDKRAGQLPVKPLVHHLWEWTKARMEDCAEDNSEANELMLKRTAYHGLNYAAPFIDMRHWSELHQDGEYFTGEYEVDDTDWKLCELIARIQYATQQYFFGKMAENYFDAMNNDVQTSGVMHQKKSVNGFNRLPEVFTKVDIVRCFDYNNDEAVKSKLRRLKEEGYVEKITDGPDKGKFRKKCQFYQ